MNSRAWFFFFVESSLSHLYIDSDSVLSVEPIVLRINSDVYDSEARAIIVETRVSLDSLNRLVNRFRITLDAISIYNRSMDLHLPKYKTSLGIELRTRDIRLVFNINDMADKPRDVNLTRWRT